MNSIVTVQDGVTWVTYEGGSQKVLDSFAEYQRWAVCPTMSLDQWEARQREVHSLI